MECPRWRLIDPHYLNVSELPDGTKVEWEHRETNRANGRAVRKLFPVPMLLDPRDPADHNYPGEIIVTQETEGAHALLGDIRFHGKPTQGMEPLNDAAEAISAAERHRWINPVETLPANGGMNAEESQFMKTMMEAFAKQVGSLPGVPVNAENTTVPKADYDELKERLARLEALIAAQGNAPAPITEAPARRV